MAMMILAAYDVHVDSRRAQLAALLQSHGDRVQRSVFVLELAAEELPELRRHACEIIDENIDSLYFFRQCSTCWEHVDPVGQATPPERVLFWSAL